MVEAQEIPVEGHGLLQVMGKKPYMGNFQGGRARGLM
jgi:hypothetical protein